MHGHLCLGWVTVVDLVMAVVSLVVSLEGCLWDIVM